MMWLHCVSPFKPSDCDGEWIGLGMSPHSKKKEHSFKNKTKTDQGPYPQSVSGYTETFYSYTFGEKIYMHGPLFSHKSPT